ncbi:stage II sporulation protein P [Xylanivirga thermophila]|uniref:stage II sporulation protein P n=1 Tax=Xylanivirga thermophila TaxID=2496273 RepID=UPI00101DE50D|nr:stage II sporulation protein P [Xylanivirga thermophila]
MKKTRRQVSNMKRKNKHMIFTGVVLMIFMLLNVVFASLYTVAMADDWYDEEAGYYTILDDAGKELTMMARQIFKDDEYISGDNKHYVINKVDKKGKKATAKYLGDVKLPELELQVDSAIYTAAQQGDKGNILLYCTHSDESYVPSDGTPSKKGSGGIFDVAESFKSSLDNHGINAVLDKTPHDPHDAGAYRRSRQTAVQLIKKHMPVTAVFDIHRDAVPVEGYKFSINGENVTKVRIVLGGRNQNKQANQELAYKIKAVADKAYPGFIKDIYIGRGAYNQELSPRSLLFEVGTYENDKEAAKRSTKYLADVVAKSMYGGTVTSNPGTPQERRYTAKPIGQQKKQGGGRGVMWVIIFVIVGAVVYLFLSSSGRELREGFSGRKRK